MPTKTKRPLRKGDKCWIRTIYGDLELATYGERLSLNHAVYSDKRGLMVALGYRHKPLHNHECLISAKPVEAQ